MWLCRRVWLRNTLKRYVISDCKRKKLAQLIWVKQKVWSFDLISKVFLLSFLGFGFTFHHFLGNQIDIENSRERDLLGGDISGARLEEEVEVGRVGLENHEIVSAHYLHHFYFCLNFLFFDDEGEVFFFPFCFGREKNKDAFSYFYSHVVF